MMSETTEEFSVHDLSRIRRLVTRAGRLVGLTVAAIDNLVTAVNEIAVNAVKYAGGRGRLTIRTGPETVSIEVSDQGPGLPDGIVDRLPDPGATGGRGLWMAKRMCSRMTIDSSRSGVTVRLVAVVS